MSTQEYAPTDASRFGHEARKVIALARVLGWSARWGGSQHRMVVLSSPDHSKRINVPTTNINHNRARSWIKQIMTHTGPDIIDAVMHGKADMTDPDMAEVVATLGTSMITYAGKQMEREAMAAAAAPAERTVTSTVVRQAKKNGTGRTEDSPGVLVRTWSDGSVDYLCRVCEGFDSPNMHAVVMHANNKHFASSPGRDKRAKAAKATKTVKVGPTLVPTPAWVADLPADALAVVNAKPVPLAEALDTFVALAPRMREVAEAIRTLEAERDAAVARAVKAEGDLDALRDLLNGLGA